MEWISVLRRSPERSEGRVVVPALVAAAGPGVGCRGALRRPLRRVAVAALTTLVPTVATLATALRGAAAEAATAASPSAAAALDLGGLRGGVLEGGADLVDVQLDAGAVVALTVGEGALLETPLRDDAGALLERFRHVLR